MVEKIVPDVVNANELTSALRNHNVDDLSLVISGLLEESEELAYRTAEKVKYTKAAATLYSLVNGFRSTEEEETNINSDAPAPLGFNLVDNILSTFSDQQRFTFIAENFIAMPEDVKRKGENLSFESLSV